MVQARMDELPGDTGSIAARMVITYCWRREAERVSVSPLSNLPPMVVRSAVGPDGARSGSEGERRGPWRQASRPAGNPPRPGGLGPRPAAGRRPRSRFGLRRAAGPDGTTNLGPVRSEPDALATAGGGASAPRSWTGQHRAADAAPLAVAVAFEVPRRAALRCRVATSRVAVNGNSELQRQAEVDPVHPERLGVRAIQRPDRAADRAIVEREQRRVHTQIDLLARP